MRTLNAHWIWMGSRPPHYLLENIARFRRLDSEKTFTYHLWLDQNYALPLSYPQEGVCIHQITSAFRSVSPFKLLPRLEGIFLREKFGAFNNIAAASDIARYAILYTMGGIYMDADAKVRDVARLRQFYKQAISSFCVYVSKANGRLYQGVILSDRYHYFWHRVFHYILSRYNTPNAYGAKREYGSVQNSYQRVFNTIMASGMGAMLGGQTQALPKSLYYFDQLECFDPIDASAAGYQYRPGLQRHNSSFW
ncbi:hypothetical protein MUU47_03955 [Scandinavium sp. H11S7]|uniref:Uncharacterized protein n=1 Tax=Scandinavium hiltneri TaxID=2926519 RepID=A0ABT2DXD5_9ENTR|nr:glycosyltransferase [Scandinavium hiltneri]MCS2160293.1 hypothetical protein [Scandinavium hiltneri]